MTAGILLGAVVAALGIALALRGADSPSPGSSAPAPNSSDPASGSPAIDVDNFVVASHPSQHCTYYHHVVGGTNVGARYDCTSNASLGSYHVWVICSDAPTMLRGPSVARGAPSVRDCPAGAHATVGGFDRDS